MIKKYKKVNLNQIVISTDDSAKICIIYTAIIFQKDKVFSVMIIFLAIKVTHSLVFYGVISYTKIFL